jgi:hypothetical protein
MATQDLNKSVLKQIESALAGLKFGSVEIGVHDGRITQIERREKIRPHQSDARVPAQKPNADPTTEG